LSRTITDDLDLLVDSLAPSDLTPSVPLSAGGEGEAALLRTAGVEVGTPAIARNAVGA